MAGVVSDLLKDVPVPKMVKVRQLFNEDCIAKDKIYDTVLQQFDKPEIKATIKPGMSIAITCGSRGVANIDTITKGIVDFVKMQGGKPFIVPTMGSHGGATAEGQREILEGYHVTEKTMGCPIRSTMETVKIGYTDEGHPVLIDRYAKEADGIIVCGRVKPHTSFRGPFESGIMKMLTIGLGKQQGAEVCHAPGFKHMAHLVPLFGKAIIKHANILFALATIENAYDDTYKLVSMMPDEIETIEPVLLKEAFTKMPRIYFDSADILIVDRIGKNISGDGMDPNITGTFSTPYASGGLKTDFVTVLDLTDETHGSALGVGLALSTTRRLLNKMKFEMTYPNAITATVLQGARIPAVMDSDKEAIQICIRCMTEGDKNKPRIIRIKDSLHLKHIMISEAMLDEAKKNPNLVIESGPEEMPFNECGNLW
ncbi:MAG: nickel pincer cofactor-dependent isomerase, group 22 [Christensenellales bacterium]